MEFNAEVKKVTNEIYQKISKTMPEIEWSTHAPYIYKINKLKKEKNAVILAHNYQTPEIYHGISDFSADSLALAIEAAKTKADMIIMCGVHFMAETAKLMSPEKKVFLPDMKAGCSLSSSITGEDVRNLKKKYPGVPVVSYVNTSADVKAETDVCCTSANAVKIVQSLGVKKVIFLPDDFLAKYVASQTDVEIISWKGTCEVHEQFKDEEIIVSPPKHKSNSPNKVKVDIEIVTSSKSYPGVYSMYLDKNNEWKIINIIVNGINLGLTFRSQFYSLMEKNNNDISTVIDKWIASV